MIELFWPAPAKAEALTAVCTLLLAIATVYLGRESRRTAKGAEDATAASQRTAEAALREAEASSQQAAASREMAEAAQRQVAAAEAVLLAQVRPILVDVPLRAPPRTRMERNRERAGRPEPVKLQDEAAIMIDFDEEGGYCSAPVRNVGPGIAVIVRARLMVPGLAGELGQARTPNLPSGEASRIDFWIPANDQQWWPPLLDWIRREQDVGVEVSYTDLAGEQPRRALLMIRCVSGQQPGPVHTGHPPTYWFVSKIRHFEGDSLDAFSESAEAAPPSEPVA